MKKQLLIIALLSIAALTARAWAAEEYIQVEINKGQMVKLSRPAASVVVADPNTADVQVVSPKLIFVQGRRIGETSFTAIDDHDDTIFEGTVEVTHNLSSLERTVRRVSPESDITFKTVDGGLVINGSAASVQEAENIRSLASAYVGQSDRVVNMITTGGGDQVMLQVKIVEMSRTDLKTLGISLQSSFVSGGVNSQAINGSDIFNTDVTPAEILRGTTTGADIFTQISIGRATISNMINALETQGLATVLAEPTLTTTTGKAASFLAGGQYPIPVRDQNGAITVSYQSFGVSLNFTPVVMSKERISILVAPEVSTLNFSNPIQVAGFTYPILDTRRAQATVELGSGQTFALAGLLKNETNNSVSKMPGVGDVPILGALFSSKRFQNDQTELVILVTPYIVRPISDPSKAQTPTTGLKQPTDAERYLLGDLYQQQDMDEKPAPAQPVIIAPEPEMMGEPVPDVFVEPAAPMPSAPVEVKPAPAIIEPMDSMEDEEPSPSPAPKNVPVPPPAKKAHGKGGFILE